MTALPYSSKSNSYIHIGTYWNNVPLIVDSQITHICKINCEKWYVSAGVDTAEVKVRENLKVTLYFNKQENAQQDITYLVSDPMSCVQLSEYLLQ